MEHQLQITELCEDTLLAGHALVSVQPSQEPVKSLHEVTKPYMHSTPNLTGQSLFGFQSKASQFKGPRSW